MADQRISELTEGMIILPTDDLVIVRGGANFMASLPPDATEAQAQGQTTTRLIWTPERVRQAVIAHAPVPPARRTDAEIDARANARITALVQSWARSSNTAIPTNRLGNSVNYVHTWARSSSSALIPLNRLTNAVTEAETRVEQWARVSGGSILIPLSKLGNLPSWVRVDATPIPIAKLTALPDWVRVAATQIPLNKLGNVPARRTDNEITNLATTAAGFVVMAAVSEWARNDAVLIPLSQLPANASYRLGAWSGSVAYRIGAIVNHGGEVWIANAANTNSEPTGANTNWTSMGAGGGTAEEGASTPEELLGTTDLPTETNGLVLNAAGWKNYHYLNIVITEEAASEDAPNRRINLTGSMLSVSKIKGTTAADSVVNATMQNTETAMFRGETTSQNNRFFYVARVATDEDNKIRISGNAAINATSGTTQTIEVWGVRVGSSNYKGDWANNRNYAKGDIVDSAGNAWIARRDVSASETAPAEGDDWGQITGGAGGDTDTTLWRGAWGAGNTYTEGQVVSRSGYRWMALGDHTSSAGNEPGTVGGGAAWTQISEGYRFALQPRVPTAAANVRTANIGVHQVGPSTSNLPAGVTVGSNEAVLVVYGAQSGSSSEHRVKVLYLLNKDTGATQHRMYVQFQDGPAATAGSHSAWFRIDNAINTPSLSFDSVSNELDLRWKDATGADQIWSVAIPPKYRGRADTVWLEATGTVLTVRYRDASGTTIATDSAEIILPSLSSEQWQRTAANPDTYLTIEAVISPSKLADTIQRQRPAGTDAAADGGANEAVYYGWSPAQLHRAAKASLPKMTVAEGTTGTDDAAKSLDASTLKQIVEALAPAGTNGRTALRKLYEDSDYVFAGSGALREVAATKWKDYDALIISVRTAPPGETESSTATDPLTSSGSVFLVDNLRRASVITGGGGGQAGAAQGQIRIVNSTYRINAYQKGSVGMAATGEVLEGTDDNAFYLQIFRHLDAKVIVHGLRLEGAPTGDGWESIGSWRFSAVTLGQQVILPAEGWAGYQDIMIFVDDSTSDTDEQYLRYPSTPFPSALLSLTDLFNNAPSFPALNANLIEIDEGFRRTTNIRVARTTNTPNANDAASPDHVAVRIVEATTTPGRLNVWGYNPPGSAAVVNAAAPYINYAHLNAPDLMAAYSLPTVYGSGDARATRANTPNWRKFQVGSTLFASSNAQNDGTLLGLPASAGLTWHTGDRDNVDHHVGETAAGDLLPGTVFSLDGTWRLRCNITVDNLEAAGTRIALQLRKVVDGNTSDDTIFIAHAGEIGSTGFTAHSSSVPTGNAFYNAPATIQLVTPWYNYGPDDRWYLVWALSRLDGPLEGTVMRVRNTYLELEKRG